MDSARELEYRRGTEEIDREDESRGCIERMNRINGEDEHKG
jgi:hypothetical protein